MEKKRKSEEDEAERKKVVNKAKFQRLLLGSQTSAPATSSSAPAEGDRSNSNPNGKAAGSNENRAGRSTPPREGDALENSNCDTTANPPSSHVDNENEDEDEDDEVRCVPAAPSVDQATNVNDCIHAKSAAGRSTSADASLEARRCIPASNNGRADKPVVITHQTISRLSSNEKSDVEPNLDYNEEEAKQTNSDEVPNDSEKCSKDT